MVAACLKPETNVRRMTGRHKTDTQHLTMQGDVMSPTTQKKTTPRSRAHPVENGAEVLNRFETCLTQHILDDTVLCGDNISGPYTILTQIHEQPPYVVCQTMYHHLLPGYYICQ